MFKSTIPLMRMYLFNLFTKFLHQFQSKALKHIFKKSSMEKKEINFFFKLKKICY